MCRCGTKPQEDAQKTAFYAMETECENAVQWFKTLAIVRVSGIISLEKAKSGYLWGIVGAFNVNAFHCFFVTTRKKGGGLPMLFGEYNYTLDEKGRMNFPPRFREEMNGPFAVARWFDDCIIAFPESQMQRIYDKLDDASYAQAKELRRTLFPSIVIVEPDKQGRILLPAKLRQHAGIDKEATVIGAGAYAEIWSTEQWQRRSEAMDATDFEAAMERVGI